MSIYNSKSFLPIVSKDNSSSIDICAFEDNRLICTFLNSRITINIFNINSDNNVQVEEFIYKDKFTNIQLLKDSFLIQNKNKIKIFQDKGTHMLLDTIELPLTIKDFIKTLFGYGEDFIYELIENKELALLIHPFFYI